MSAPVDGQRDLLGDRQYPYPTHLGGYVYAYLGGVERGINVLGAVHLSPDEARALAATLEQAAADLDEATA